jgi:hypothetical protein
LKGGAVEGLDDAFREGGVGVWRATLGALVILGVMASSPLAHGICQVALPEYASYCEQDDSGMCCVIEREPGCYEVVCHVFDSCAWASTFRLCF